MSSASARPAVLSTRTSSRPTASIARADPAVAPTHPQSTVPVFMAILRVSKKVERRDTLLEVRVLSLFFRSDALARLRASGRNAFVVIKIRTERPSVKAYADHL